MTASSEGEMIKVGITGATGLVGSDLVSYLSEPKNVGAKDSGVKVRAIARRADAIAGRGDLEVACADVLDKAALEAAFVGLDVVVHAAGFVDPLAEKQKIFAVNLKGTENAFQAARACGVRQFIHISSLSVITGQHDQFDLDEQAPLCLCGEAYADSKVESEKYLQELMRGGLPITILRPGFIYGEGERAWLKRVMQSVSKGQAILVDGGARSTNVVYVRNLSSLIKVCLLNEAAYDQIFNVTDPEFVSKKMLFDTVADALGVPRIKKNLPRAVVKSLFEIMGTIGSISGIFNEKSKAQFARFSPGAYRLIAVNQGFSIEKARKVLGYPFADCVGFSQAMQETIGRISQAK